MMCPIPGTICGTTRRLVAGPLWQAGEEGRSAATRAEEEDALYSLSTWKALAPPKLRHHRSFQPLALTLTAFPSRLNWSKLRPSPLREPASVGFKHSPPPRRCPRLLGIGHDDGCCCCCYSCSPGRAVTGAAVRAHAHVLEWQHGPRVGEAAKPRPALAQSAVGVMMQSWVVGAVTLARADADTAAKYDNKCYALGDVGLGGRGRGASAK
jgi:hypothetical protein